MQTELIVNNTPATHAELEAYALPVPENDAFAGIVDAPPAGTVICLVPSLSGEGYATVGSYPTEETHSPRQNAAYLRVL